MVLPTAPVVPHNLTTGLFGGKKKVQNQLKYEKGFSGGLKFHQKVRFVAPATSVRSKNTGPELDKTCSAKVIESAPRHTLKLA